MLVSFRGGKAFESGTAAAGRRLVDSRKPKKKSLVSYKIYPVSSSSSVTSVICGSRFSVFGVLFDGAKVSNCSLAVVSSFVGVLLLRCARPVPGLGVATRSFFGGGFSSTLTLFKPAQCSETEPVSRQFESIRSPSVDIIVLLF